MSFFDYFRASKKKSATVAKERLQIIVAHERGLRHSNLEFLPKLQQELLAVVRKYVQIEDDQIKISVEKDGHYEVLELNIALPEMEDRQPK
ncbi:cell division topological specificity factor MinE [Thioflexithrix psekupsensis]|jgi:cell division topological specificity factor|uniref:Cell division topological specificity factor n=1 Tax=Thioflexithrix psekupsensis TaxID=1570016 RepID=A0A251XB73_9GAMM|nr:cell division topological specificity factor MinE [Thioflexithrix psekupsensis]OUD15543.1 cell division topological specificity factor MinE [Thioflexithrix psekupsensis]